MATIFVSWATTPRAEEVLLLYRHWNVTEVVAGSVRAAVVDGDPHGLAAVADPELRAQRQAVVGGRIFLRVEGLPAGCRVAREAGTVVRRYHLPGGGRSLYLFRVPDFGDAPHGPAGIIREDDCEQARP